MSQPPARSHRKRQRMHQHPPPACCHRDAKPQPGLGQRRSATANRKPPMFRLRRLRLSRLWMKRTRGSTASSGVFAEAAEGRNGSGFTQPSGAEKLNAAHSLARPAPLCKNESLRIGRATKQACELERLVTFGPRGQQACLFKCVCRADFPVDPVGPVRYFFVHLAGCDPGSAE